MNTNDIIAAIVLAFILVVLWNLLKYVAKLIGGSLFIKSVRKYCQNDEVATNLILDILMAEEDGDFYGKMIADIGTKATLDYVVKKHDILIVPNSFDK